MGIPPASKAANQEESTREIVTHTHTRRKYNGHLLEARVRMRDCIIPNKLKSTAFSRIQSIFGLKLYSHCAHIKNT